MRRNWRIKINGERIAMLIFAYDIAVLTDKEENNFSTKYPRN